jgi:hypothetical protein
MRQFLEPLSLEISPDSLSQGEPAIRQAIASQNYNNHALSSGDRPSCFTSCTIQETVAEAD